MTILVNVFIKCFTRKVTILTLNTIFREALDAKVGVSLIN